jgi:hypothetical protein
MTSRSRWVVVRNEKEGKQWQLVFPDGRVLKTIPIPADSIRVSGAHGQEGERDVDAPGAGHDADNLHRH